MNKNGSSSIFIVIVLSAIIAFLVVMINNVHQVSFVNIARDNLYLSIDSQLMDYDKYIFDNYGLSSVSRGGLEDSITKDFKDNTSGIKSIHNYSDLKVDLISTRTLQDDWTVNYQIGKFMEYRVLWDVVDRFFLMKNKEERITEEFQETEPLMEKISEHVKEIDGLINESKNDSINDLVEKFNDGLIDVDFEYLEENLEDYDSLRIIRKRLSRREFKLAIESEGRSLRKYYDKYCQLVNFLEDGQDYCDDIKSKLGHVVEKIEDIEKSSNDIINMDLVSGYMDGLKNNCLGAVRYSEYYHGNDGGKTSNKVFLDYIEDRIGKSLDSYIRGFSKIEGEYSRTSFPRSFEDDLDIIKKFSELGQLEKRKLDKKTKDKVLNYLKKPLELVGIIDKVIDEELLKNLPSSKHKDLKKSPKYIYPNKIVNRRYEEIERIKEEMKNGKKDTVESLKDIVLKNKSDDYDYAGMSDNIKLSEYIIQTFQDRSENSDYDYFDKYERKAYFKNSEIEYILFGNKSRIANIDRTKYLIMIIRAPINAYHIYNDTLKYNICNEVGLIIGSLWGGGPFVTHGLVLSWASLESWEDYKSLVEGEAVPLVKDRESWKTDFISQSTGHVTSKFGDYDNYVETFIDISMYQGISENKVEEYLNETIEDEETINIFMDSLKSIRESKENSHSKDKIKKSKKKLYTRLKDKNIKIKKGQGLDLDIYYQDYLRLLMMVQPLDIKIQRVKDLIYLNIYEDTGEIKKLDQYITEVNLNLHMKHRSMFLDNGRDIDINVIRGY